MLTYVNKNSEYYQSDSAQYKPLIEFLKKMESPNLGLEEKASEVFEKIARGLQINTNKEETSEITTPKNRSFKIEVHVLRFPQYLAYIV